MEVGTSGMAKIFMNEPVIKIDGKIGINSNFRRWKFPSK